MSLCVVIRNESEAIFLKELGLRIAGAWEDVLELWIATSEKAGADWLADLAGPGVALIRDLSGIDRKSRVLRAAKQEWPRLLVVGKNAKTSSHDDDLPFSQDVFEDVCCQVLAIRLGRELCPANSRILVPSAGGRHSRRVLKLAHALSPLGTVAFQMRPDADELSTEVGQRHLGKMLGKARVPADDVLTKVVTGDDFTRALAEEVVSETRWESVWLWVRLPSRREPLFSLAPILLRSCLGRDSTSCSPGFAANTKRESGGGAA